jgi:hypothetical protein
VGTGELQGWYADPFRIHEARYFSVGQPTALVRDGGTESYDEPPAGDQDPAAATATTTAATTAAATAATMEPSTPTGSTPTGSTPAGPYGAARDAYQYSAAATRARRGSRPRTVAGAALLAGAAIIGALVVTNRPQGLSPVAFVRQSAQQTLAQHTADITLSMRLQFAGQNTTVHGTGELDFSTDAMAMDLTGGASGHGFDMKEILVKGTLYFAFSVDGHYYPLGSGGSTWSQMPVPTSGSASSDDGDPYTMLSQIEREGSTLRTLGTRVIRGVTCTGYAVTPPADGGPQETITIWADSQQLVREISDGVQMSTPAGVGQAGVTIDFFNFGAPVHIAAPPPGTTYAA